MKIDISIEVSADQAPIINLEQFVQKRNAEATAIPQVGYFSAPALEVRELGEGKRISQQQMLDELGALGEGWRIETRQELYALVDLTNKNQHGAYTQDASLFPEPYWTADAHPAHPAARVVVWFDYGLVSYYFVSVRARARAVRVSGQ